MEHQAHGVYEEVVRLDGTSAARTAALGAGVVAVAAVFAALVWGDPWPLRVANGLVVVPVAALGIFMIALAIYFHVRRAVWRLRADAAGVTLCMEAASGRRIKREAVRIDDVTEIAWIEGDDDVSPGVRLRTQAGPGLFIPANPFDVDALWAFCVAHWPALRQTGRSDVRAA